MKHCGNCLCDSMIKRLVVLQDTSTDDFLTAQRRSEIESIRQELIKICKGCGVCGKDGVQNSISNHGQCFVHLDAATDPDLVMQHAEVGDVSWLKIIQEQEQQEPQPLTKLDFESEQIFRQRMAEIFSLDPVKLLFICHVMRGGALYDFGDTMKKTLRFCREKWSTSRVWAMKKSLIDTFPLLNGFLIKRTYAKGVNNKKELS